MMLMIVKKVIDLNAGLGGRVYAFEKAGFEILATIDNDIENCEIMKSCLPNTNIINTNLLEINPDSLPDADLIVAKYIQQSFSVSGKKRDGEINITINEIIAKKILLSFCLRYQLVA